MGNAGLNAQEIIDRIRGRAHYRIIVRPTAPPADRFGSLANMRRTIEETSVLVRGWDYPHVSLNAEDWERGNDYVASRSAFEDRYEYWRMYLSAQFIHMFTLLEDHPAIRDQLARACIGSSKGVTGFIDIIGMTWTETELFEFAAGLAVRDLFEGGADITIEMNNLMGRRLSVSGERFFAPDFRATGASYCHNLKCSVDDLVSQPRDIAIQAVAALLDRFGHTARPDSLRTVQEEMLRS